MNSFNVKIQNEGIVLSNSPSKKASYITSDGQFINLQDNRIPIIGYSSKEVTHFDFGGFLKLKKINKPNNLIRLNSADAIYLCEHVYIELSKKEPTKAQYEALLKWLDFIYIIGKKKMIEININRHNHKIYEFASSNNENGLLPEDIIKEIKKLYKVIG